MKTKEEMQAIVNEIREVCKLHGVVLLPGPDAIVLCEAEQVNECPFVLQKSVDDDTMMLTNKVDEHEQRVSGFAHEIDHFTIFGIGDVPGITKPRIVVSQYAPQRADNPAAVFEKADVESLDEVESIGFVKTFMIEPGFTHLSIDMSHGPFGTLMAWFSNHQPMVIGFIEGPTGEEMLAKWPNLQESSHGSV